MKHATHTSTKPQAFTLVEMLIVVAIIALLMGILVPALGKARDTAKSVVCKSNLKQLATAFRTYAEDYRGFAPDEITSMVWNIVLLPYADDVNVFVCPADIDKDDAIGFTSYSWRDSFEVDDPDAALDGKNLLSTIASNIILVFDSEPDWHEEGSRNAALIDTSAGSFTNDQFDENMSIAAW